LKEHSKNTENLFRFVVEVTKALASKSQSTGDQYSCEKELSNEMEVSSQNSALSICAVKSCKESSDEIPGSQMIAFSNENSSTKTAKSIKKYSNWTFDEELRLENLTANLDLCDLNDQKWRQISQ
jgi:hypothetical protein